MSWKALKQCSDFAARLCPSQDPAAVIGVLHILKFLSDFEWQQTAFSPPDELTHGYTAPDLSHWCLRAVGVRSAYGSTPRGSVP